MGFSLVAEGVIKAALPEASWTSLVSKLGYSVGFLIVILGQQQLFTENTLTAVLPVMARRGGRTLAGMLRLWGVVLAANLAGAFVMALALAHTRVFDDHIRQAFDEIGRRAISHDALTILIKGVFAGWLIALTVWVLPASAASKFPIILVLTWLVGAAELSHIIAGSIETMYLAARGQTTWANCFFGYMVPTLIGNTIGGVALVAGVNHAQVVGERKAKAPDRLAHAGT
jgi:formate/nitrite transporter FocA (FNT family)